MENSPSQLETRVTRLETHMEHMASAISQILDKIGRLETKFDAKFDAVNQRITALEVSVAEKFGEVGEKLSEIKVWALTLLGGGILTVIARALHWL